MAQFDKTGGLRGATMHPPFRGHVPHTAATLAAGTLAATLARHTMNDFADSNLAVRLQRARARRNHDLHTALRAWWARLWMDERTAYLSQASSLSDLEQRMRQWDLRKRGAHRWVW